MNTFKGYPRPNGSIGIRNHILIMAVDECCEGVARNISNDIEGAIVVTNYNTCMLGGNEEMLDTMIHTGINPNVAGVIVVAMGCGSIDPERIAQPIRETGIPAHSLTVIKNKGTRKTIEEGLALAKKIESYANSIEKIDCPLSSLMIAVKCGGSDTSSGIASNPSVGAAIDKMIDLGATCMAGELIELIGCEDILRKRAVSTEVADKLCRLIAEEERRWHVKGIEVETMSIGNSVGGLTTIDEKSHGAMHKTGTRPIQDVLRINHLHREKPTKSGFYLTEATHLCGAAAMHFASLGAHMILWTSGGAGFNNAIIPVIRISGNENLITEDMDIDASGIMSATSTVENISNQIVTKIEAVANGQKTNIEGIGFSYASLYQKEQRLERILHICPL